MTRSQQPDLAIRNFFLPLHIPIMVFRSILAAVTASFALSAFAIPTSLKVDSTSLGLVPRAAEGEPFQCPDPAGAATAKQALVGAGATTVG